MLGNVPDQFESGGTICPHWQCKDENCPEAKPVENDSPTRLEEIRETYYDDKAPYAFRGEISYLLELLDKQREALEELKDRTAAGLLDPAKLFNFIKESRDIAEEALSE